MLVWAAINYSEVPRYMMSLRNTNVHKLRMSFLNNHLSTILPKEPNATTGTHPKASTLHQLSKPKLLQTLSAVSPLHLVSTRPIIVWLCALVTSLIVL